MALTFTAASQPTLLPSRSVSPPDEVSPRALKSYMERNPLTAELNEAAALKQLMKDLPLPRNIEKVLMDHLYLVPPEGLFLCSSSCADLRNACPREDLVESLVNLARTQRFANVALVHGQRRTGKTFSMPWALTEAGRTLDGGGRRRSLLLHIPCHAITAPSLEDIPLLLLVAEYLKARTVFDEFIAWKTLPAALEGFLASRATQLMPLHFILQDSNQADVVEVTGCEGVLYGRNNLGVVRVAQPLPQPSVHLVAGILLAYNPTLYPTSLLRILATAGRDLNCVASEPVVSLETLRMERLRGHAPLKDSHLGALRKVMNRGTLRVKGHIGTPMLQLVHWGLLERSPLDRKRLFLADPKLLTICEMQTGQGAKEVDEQFLETLLQQAECKVLEMLARRDLVPNILNSLGLAEDPSRLLLWGNLGKCELDLLIVSKAGPLVLVSCKRSQAQQSAAAFSPHIKAIETEASRIYKGMKNTTAKMQDSATAQEAKECYEHEPAVLAMRSMLAGQGLVYVGLSDINADESHPFPGDHGVIEATFEDKSYNVNFTYKKLLLKDLVTPVLYEEVHMANCLFHV